MDFLAPHSAKVLSLLRIVTALTFMTHGLMKQFSFPAAMPGAGGAPTGLMLAAAWLEIIGGALLVLGLFTRPVAFVLSGFMAVAYFMAHASKSFYPVLNGGEPAVLFCFIFLYLAFAGGGLWSLDAIVRKRP
ncbi:MAG TPA: DoxX family protein [Caulobacter sp.]|nr:DoxX family protein [Caulobacter sp.]